MEYSVGSLADLIGGTNTPNKPKVVAKKIAKAVKVKKVAAENGENTESPKIKQKPSMKKIHTGPKKNPKPKHLKRKLQKVSAENESVEEENLEDNDAEAENESMQEENLEDSDAEDQPKPKKMKLSRSEQNAEKRVKKKEVEARREKDPEVAARTIFVGNVPLKIQKSKIEQHFKKYGPIESVRIRGLAVADPKVSKKVAAIKQEFHPERSSAQCYIKFQNKEDAVKALAENGKLFEEHHLRVNSCIKDKSLKPDESKAVFIGNLPFNVEDEELWKLFESCGEILNVRVVRDFRTNMGKGFAYVNFVEADSVQLALEMENVQLRNRELRISLCNINLAKKNKKKNKVKKINRPGKPKTGKPFEKKTNGETNDEDKPVVKENFQGTQFTDKKKKNKPNKGLLQKKKLAKKVAPKPE